MSGGGMRKGPEKEGSDKSEPRITRYDPISIIRLAAEKVPVVWLALALTAIAAAVGLAKTYLGEIEYPGLIAVLIAAMLAMLFLFIISQGVATLGKRAAPIALVLMWSMCLVVVCFMGSIVTAVFFYQPEAVVRLLHLPPSDNAAKGRNDTAGTGPILARPASPAPPSNPTRKNSPVTGAIPTQTPPRPNPPSPLPVQIGIALTCTGCPDDVVVADLVNEIGISLARDETPPVKPSDYKLLNAPSRGVRWTNPFNLPDGPARVRLVIPDADETQHGNDGIAHNDISKQQREFELAPGQKAKATISVEPEGFAAWRKATNKSFRVDISRVQGSPQSGLRMRAGMPASYRCPVVR
jgi:hypothetical protein